MDSLSPSDPTASRGARATLVWLVVAAVALVALVALTVVVALGGAGGGDDAVRELFRPDDVWGTTQERVDHLVEGLDPRTCLVLLLLIGGVIAAARRSARPLLLALWAASVTVLTTTALQVALQRPDTHGETPGLGGSYPSGHVATLVVCVGTVVVLARLERHLAAWAAVALAGAAMGAALLLQAAHWASDVVGGALLGTVVLASTALLARVGTARPHRSSTRVDSTR
jgi:undecaprenyl-diphosphatase